MLPFYETRKADLEVQHLHDFNYPLHLHAHAELLYLFEGTLEMQIDSVPYQLGPGDLALCFPNALHSFGDGVNVRGLIMIFLPEVCSEYSRALHQMRTPEPVLRREKNDARLHTCMELLENERATTANAAIYRAYTQMILAQVLPALPLEPNAFPESGDTLVRALQYLSANFTEPVTLESTARAVGVSAYHLSHLLGDRMKVHFRGYLNTLRIQHAKELLRCSDAPITEVMYSCGFQCQRTFYRAFQEETGMTPAKFRQSIQLGTPPGSFSALRER